MAQPDVKSLITAVPLINASIAYRNRNYIADRVFPIIDNVAPKAKIAKYLKGAWYRDEAGIRGPGARAPRGGYPTTTVAIATQEYAFAKEVTDEDRRFVNAQGAPPLQPDIDALEFCADKIDLKKERLVASTILSGTWVDGNAGGEDAAGLWAAGSSNTFLADIRKATAAIQAACGMTPNKLILDFKTYNSLKEETTLLTKIQYTERGVLTVDLLAALLDLDEVLVGSAIYSSAKETKAGTDFTAVQIWEVNAGKGAGFLFYAPPTMTLKSLSAGAQARVAYENGMPRRVMKWREEAEHQDVYEVAEEVDILQVCSECGYLFNDTYAT